jgi:hypothetical protein
MVQAVSRKPLAVEAQICSRVSPCGLCGGQTGIGTGFCPVFPRQYHSTVVLHTHMSSGRCTIRRLVGAVQRRSYPIDMNKTIVLDILSFKVLCESEVLTTARMRVWRRAVLWATVS